MSKRLEVITLLQEFANLVPESIKARAYSIASDSLKSLTDKEFKEITWYQSIYGIGPGISAKIEQYMSTGSIDQLDELRELNRGKLDPRLYKIRTKSITKRILLHQAVDWYEKILSIKDLPTVLNTAGSLRRGEELVGDLDILVSHLDYDDACSILTREFTMVTRGNEKASFILDEGTNFRMDVISVTPENYACQLLYLTGSTSHNIKMRSIANQKKKDGC